MTYSEACPNCHDEDYIVDEYNDSFDQFGGTQWWDCTCSKCGQKFTITKEYKLVEVMVEEAEAKAKEGEQA